MPLKVKSGVIWCNKTVFPLYYGFCPDAKAWKAEMKRLGCPHISYPSAFGMCTEFIPENGAKKCVIVTLQDMMGVPYGVVTSALVHESLHVWQIMCKQAGEAMPGWETEAYTVQYIYEQLYQGFMATRSDMPSPYDDVQASRALTLF